MNLLGLLATACTVLAVGGVVMAAVGWYGRDPRESTGRRRVRVSGAATAARARVGKVAAAMGLGAVVWLLSGWPVAGLTAAALVLAVPYFFGAGAVAKRRIDRLQALDEWTRRLADTIAVGQAPVPAIVESAEYVGVPIRPEVTRLATRLATPRLDRQLVLAEFAREIDDAVGDQIADELQIAVSLQTTDRVPDMLRQLADSVSEDVRSRRETEARRAGPRSESRLIVIVQVAVVVGLSFLSTYMAPYDTVTGQLVMALLAVAMLASLALLRKYSLGQLPPRILLDEARR